MLPAPVPANETQRLAELYALNILDTPREERFDAIVRLAQQVFQVPMVYIALIDANRQWFKAKCGFDVTETAREISFCGHAILSSTVLIVPDALEDDRFADNPLVTGPPHVRFYVGHPLAGPQGLNVGTLCLADHRPRHLDAAELALLHTLAGMAAEQLQLVNLLTTQQQLLATQAELLKTQQRLESELREAADYVRSLLPPRLEAGPVLTDWIYQSSSQLGGDLLGYHWLDAEHFAIYLFDVCGHGVGASLLASSVQSVLSRQTLPNCDFHKPEEVISALDRAFPMERHHDKFFTIWYGVYHVPSRMLRYSAAGHHPAALVSTDGSELALIGQRELMIGVLTGRQLTSAVVRIGEHVRLYVFSDGAFEIHRPDGTLLGLEGLQGILRETAAVTTSRVDAVRQRLQTWAESSTFADDFSLMELQFV